MQAGPWELQDLGRRPGETQQLAQSASGLKGYIIVVKGYTDSTGSAAMNTTLSQDRAQAVINYLVQQGGIKIRISRLRVRTVKPTKRHRTRPPLAEQKIAGLRLKFW
jgi:hypothetical protein